MSSDWLSKYANELWLVDGLPFAKDLIDQRSKTSPFTPHFWIAFTPLGVFEATVKPFFPKNLKDSLFKKKELFDFLYIKNFTQSAHEIFYFAWKLSHQSGQCRQLFRQLKCEFLCRPVCQPSHVTSSVTLLSTDAIKCAKFKTFPFAHLHWLIVQLLSVLKYLF